MFQNEKPKANLVEEEQEKKPDIRKNWFGKGKSLFIDMQLSQMVSYLSEYALVVKFFDKNTRERVIGQTLVNVQSFASDIKTIIQDDFEKFKRQTFKLTNESGESVGWFDMSISILQRPFTYMSRMINKKISNSTNLQEQQQPTTNLEIDQENETNSVQQGEQEEQGEDLGGQQPSLGKDSQDRSK